MREDTIFAVATGRGPAGIAVVRLSGPQSGPILRAVTGRHDLEPRRAARATIRDRSGEVIDEGLILWFPAPGSFTGEDVAEFHVHGGRAIVTDLFATLLSWGLRQAEPGEFTRRAFENGKLDLTAAEGIADLVAAETGAQRRQALHQMQGCLAELYNGWRDALVWALAHLEADIDFADDDLPGEPARDARRRIEALLTEIQAHLADAWRGERLRDGVRVAVLGPPNAGKSSLVNALARRDAAIVSDEPGTTRDVVEVHLDLGGFPVTLADTAGLRETDHAVEQEGVRRSRRAADDADLRLLIFDGAVWPNVDGATAALIDDTAVVVVNKSDLDQVPDSPEVAQRPALAISATTGEGLTVLLGTLTGAVEARFGGEAGPAPTRLRHRSALETAATALVRALDAGDLELMAEDVRLAARELGRITGQVDVEDILDVIFRDFCIGK